jgi:hypothetical protein
VTRAASGLVAAILALATTAHAQDLEPRAYSNAPVGLNFLILGYGYSHGEVGFESSIPIKGAELTTNSAFVGYGHVFGLFGRTTKLDVVLPYAWISGRATILGQALDRDISGLGDPRVRLSALLYGGPALSMPEFADYTPGFILGASVSVTAPLGEYDSSRLLNVGTNRWSVKPELGFSQTFGPVTLELAPSVTFYTENNDFVGHKLTKEPIYAVQGHVIYHTRIGFWAAVDGTYYGGGRESIDGKQGSEKEHARVGATLAFPIGKYNSLKLYGSAGATPRFGGDFVTGGIAWQLRWGGGL